MENEWKYQHSSRLNETRKSFEVLSEPFPMADPGGKGAGIRPQFPRLILRASRKYRSVLVRLFSMPSAAVLKSFAASLNALSLPPTTNWALKASTDCMGGGLVTIVAVREVGGFSAFVAP